MITSFFPIQKFQVHGNSMEPIYKSGEYILIVRYLFRKPKINDIVVIQDAVKNKKILKRIKKILDENYFVLGDNEKESTDSRQFGWIQRKDIVGKLIYRL